MTASQQLQQLLSDEWEFRMQEYPTFATTCGDHRFNDRLPGTREDDFARRRVAIAAFASRLDQIRRADLDDTGQLNYDLFGRELHIMLEELDFGIHYIPLTKMTGLPVYFPDIQLLTPFNSVHDYDMYLQRMGAFTGFVDDFITLMESGAAQGYLPPRSALSGVLESFQLHAAAAPHQSVFYTPFEKFPAHFLEGDRRRLAGTGLTVVRDAVQPAYARLALFLEQAYLPQLPDGGTLLMPAQRAYYEFCVRRYTTLAITPAEVHQTGLDEVARIRAEMEAVMQAVGFTGDLRAFSAALRQDERFFVNTPAELMKEAAWIMKRIEGELPRLFKTLPRTPFGLREIPAHIAPQSTTAYYFPPAGDLSTAGFYYVNTHDLKSRPLYELEALSLHEAVPGHHLQLALQLELPDVPNFRRYSDATAFIEGWALYAERLGLEVGFYTDPYANYGRLVYEMWRAVRLVVDTGLHYDDWTRQQAIDYMLANTALSEHNIATEVDRYIGWPGQAVAYKTGELKISALRREAEAQLGERFDLRAFHDVLLQNGAIPLDALEAIIDRWIAAQNP
jgi:uncharacterized protein (DUF885 family)